jgi:hypothetical protein
MNAKEFQRIAKRLLRAELAYRRARYTFRHSKTKAAYRHFVATDIQYMNALRDVAQFISNTEFQRRIER